MGLKIVSGRSESRFTAYVEAMISALGQTDRAALFRSYSAGLPLPGDRKSVELVAARVEPGRVQAAHQSLHHFVAKAEWSDDAVLAAVRERVLPKKGWHSVGVARQYCGATWQTGPLPGRGEPFRRQRSCQPTARLTALSAEGVGG